jgi:hypothetical protein
LRVQLHFNLPGHQVSLHGHGLHARSEEGPVHFAFQDTKYLYMVMDYMPGQLVGPATLRLPGHQVSLHGHGLHARAVGPATLRLPGHQVSLHGHGLHARSVEGLATLRLPGHQVSLHGHGLHARMSEDAGIEPRTVATLAVAVRRSNPFG